MTWGKVPLERVNLDTSNKASHGLSLCYGTEAPRELYVLR
jgi:hypothetical protein